MRQFYSNKGNGIGASLSKKLAKRGATLVLLDIDEESGNRVLNEIKSNGGKAFFFKCDASKPVVVYNVADEVNPCSKNFEKNKTLQYYFLRSKAKWVMLPFSSTTQESYMAKRYLISVTLKSKKSSK